MKLSFTLKHNTCFLYSYLVFVVLFFVLHSGHAFAQGVKPSAAGKDSQQTEELQNRIKQLERQLVDMQVMIGTLESLVQRQRSNPSASLNTQSFSDTQSEQNTGSSAFSDERRARTNQFAARVTKNTSQEHEDRFEGIETQIRAMSSQIAQLTIQLSGMSEKLNKVTAQGFNAQNSNQDPQIVSSLQNSQGTNTTRNSQADRRNRLQGQNAKPLKPRDNSQKTIPRNYLSALPKNTVDNSRGSSASPEELYDEAYGHMLRRDYGAAEATFREFLKLHSKDKLAGNAQYWLGETYFVRGNYRKAADHFLKGYSKFRKGQKAPDSLLKLALSLRKLGQKSAACTTFAELSKKFPKAPSHVKQRAVSERQSMGCS